MKLRLKYTGLFVSIFVFVALAILLLTIYILTANKRFFADKTLFYTTFNNSYGLSKGAQVYMKGFKIGYIDDFFLDENNDVRTNFYIYNEFINKIATRSIIVKSVHPVTSVSNIELIILPKGILTPTKYYHIPSSDSYLGNLILSQNHLSSTGSDKLTYIVDNLNSFLIEMNSLIIDDSLTNKKSISEILASSVSILEETESLLKMLNGDYNNPGELIKSFRNFSKTSEEMIKTSKLMTKTLFLIDTVTNRYKNPDGILAKMLDPTGENIFNPTTQVLNNLQKLLKEHEKFAEYLNSKSSDFSILLQKLDMTLLKLNTTLEGINNSPFLGSGSNEQKITEPKIIFPVK
ncbi:MAG TPA: MlaD family protein [Melioribacteraceae bacterium]|nr:MlaD family protein [Melioribacteraceae bacterium]